MFEQIVAHIPGLQDVLAKGLLSNQFFVGGVGAMLLGAGAYFVRSLPRRVYSVVHRWSTSSLTIRSNQTSKYDTIAMFCLTHRVPWYGRAYVLNNTLVTPGYGMSIIRWKRRWITVTRQLASNGAGAPVDQLDLVFWTRDKKVVNDFINDATYVKPSENMMMKFSKGQGWIGTYKRKRSLDTIFANGAMVEAIQSRLNRFRASEQWYAKRGVPYKFVSILHGKPGCGKTSLIHAIAGEYGLNIHYLSHLSAFEQIKSLDDNAIVVIEDIDTLGKLNRDSDLTESDISTGASMSLHQILNTLDGLATPHGLMVFMTTNKIGDLDPALVRPGRVDLLIEVTYLELDAMTRMFIAFYEEESRSKIEDWVARHGVHYQPTSGATLQEIFLTQTVDDALVSLTALKPMPKLKVIAARRALPEDAGIELV